MTGKDGSELARLTPSAGAPRLQKARIYTRTLNFCPAIIPALEDPQSKLPINIEAPPPVLLAGTQNCEELLVCERHPRPQLARIAPRERPAPCESRSPT